MPVEIRITAVDVARQAVEFALQALVFGDVFARTCGDLQISHMHSMFGVTIEQIAKSLKPVRQALGIIEAIDADHEGMALDGVEESVRGTALFGLFRLSREGA